METKRPMVSFTVGPEKALDVSSISLLDGDGVPILSTASDYAMVFGAVSLLHKRLKKVAMIGDTVVFDLLVAGEIEQVAFGADEIDGRAVVDGIIVESSEDNILY